MSAALKIAIIVTALCVLSNAETKVTNEKEKRGSDKEPPALQVIQQQQKTQPISQHTFQFVYPQGAGKLSSSPSNQYSPQQLQYIFQQAVLPQLQKQAVPAPLFSQQYVIPQQQQLQYIAAQQQQAVQPQQKGAAPVVGHAAQQQQAYLGGQYYLNPYQFAGSQYHHPGAGVSPYFFVPQHQAQQYYLPQGHHPAAATVNPAFYFGGGFQGNPFLGNQQYYFPQNHPQQILNQNVKGASGLEARGKDSYVLPPYDGIQQLQQYSTLPDSVVEANVGVRAGPTVVQTQQRESPTLTLSGKYGSKTSPERQQG